MDERTQLTALPSAWIDRLFARLLLAYGSKFRDMWRDQDAAEVKGMWAQELAGVTADQLRGALESLRTKCPTWPPTLYEFLDLCKPAAAKVNHEAAFYEAIRGVEHRKRGEPGQWSNRAIYWAAQDVTPFDVLNQTWPQIRSRWIGALDARLADGDLPEIPAPPLQLPQTLRNEDINTENLRRIHALIDAAPKVGPRAWAKKILERHANGDKMLDPIALKMALDSDRIAAGGAPR